MLHEGKNVGSVSAMLVHKCGARIYDHEERYVGDDGDGNYTVVPLIEQNFDAFPCIHKAAARSGQALRVEVRSSDGKADG